VGQDAPVVRKRTRRWSSEGQHQRVQDVRPAGQRRRPRHRGRDRRRLRCRRDSPRKDIITPILAIPGKTDFSALTFTIRKSHFLYGDFINTVISFLSIAAAVFFLVVKPINALMARRKTEPDVLSTTRDCPYCLSSIPIAATRCAFCTADVSAAS